MRRRRRKGGGRNCRSGRSVPQVYDHKCLADLRHVPHLCKDSRDGACSRSRDLNIHLVGHYLDKRLVFLHVVALLYHPLQDLTLGDALAEVRQLELVDQLKSLILSYRLYPLLIPRPSVVKQRGACAGDSFRIGDVLVFELGERDDRVKTGDPPDRRLQVVECLVCYGRGYFCPHA